MIVQISPEQRLSVRIKAARLRLEGLQERGGLGDLFKKRAFAPSPQTQEQVQQEAQATGQQPNQDPNSQAVAPSGMTLDDLAGMVDQFYQEATQGLQQLQTQLSQLQTVAGGEGGEKGGNFQALNDRLMKIEQMLVGTQASPEDQAAAQAEAPAPGGQVPTPAPVPPDGGGAPPVAGGVPPGPPQ